MKLMEHSLEILWEQLGILQILQAIASAVFLVSHVKYKIIINIDRTNSACANCRN